MTPPRELWEELRFAEDKIVVLVAALEQAREEGRQEILAIKRRELTPEEQTHGEQIAARLSAPGVVDAARWKAKWDIAVHDGMKHQETADRERRHRKWALGKARLYHDCSEHYAEQAARERERADRAEAEAKQAHADWYEKFNVSEVQRQRIEALEGCLRLWLEDIDMLATETCWCMPSAPGQAEVKCPPCLARALLAPDSGEEEKQ